MEERGINNSLNIPNLKLKKGWNFFEGLIAIDSLSYNSKEIWEFGWRALARNYQGFWTRARIDDTVLCYFICE